MMALLVATTADPTSNAAGDLLDHVTHWVSLIIPSLAGLLFVGLAVGWVIRMVWRAAHDGGYVSGEERRARPGEWGR
jgi:hypothetical protein